MRKPRLIACTMAALLFVAACSTGTNTVASKAPVRVPVISYSTLTLNSIPAGAGVEVNGRFVGYSPVTIPVRLADGRLESWMSIVYEPTAPGEFKQQGSIGLWDGGVIIPGGYIVAYMYDGTGAWARAAAGIYK